MSDLFIDTNVFLRIFNREERYEDTINSLAMLKAKGWDF